MHDAGSNGSGRVANRTTAMKLAMVAEVIASELERTQLYISTSFWKGWFSMMRILSFRTEKHLMTMYNQGSNTK